MYVPLSNHIRVEINLLTIFAVKLLSRDFYHISSGWSARGFSKSFTSCLSFIHYSHCLTRNVANLEVKSKAPNGVAFTVKGKSDHKIGAIAGQVYIQLHSFITVLFKPEQYL